MLEHRLFYIPSFKIYGARRARSLRGCSGGTDETSVPSGGVAGLYDYGPTGCAVKANVTAFWRKVRAVAWSACSRSLLRCH